MRFLEIIVVFLLIVTKRVFAQEKEITLEEIWSGIFDQEKLRSLQSLSKGTQYAVLNNNRDDPFEMDK